MSSLDMMHVMVSSVKQTLGKSLNVLPIAVHVSYKQKKLQILNSSQCQVVNLCFAK
jgi:hypothetical protein